METKIPLLVFVGPTASGKTALSIQIAEHLQGEIISADSMQIYKGMDIGTAKPSKEEQRGIPHYLMDFLEPDKTYSVAQYVKQAREIIRDIYQREKVPIVVGGTGLYIDSLVNHTLYSEYSSNDPSHRRKLEEMAEKKGNDFLWQMLFQIDPETAQSLHPNNTGRVIRAIELFQATGVTMSEQKRLSHSQPSPYNSCMIGLNYKNRQTLYDKIDLRVDKMVESGLLREVENFMKKGYSETAFQAIGYKEFYHYLEGNGTLEDAVESIKIGSRRYAKRQLTWFRRNDSIHWLYWEDYQTSQELFQAALSIAQKFLETKAGGVT